MAKGLLLLAPTLLGGAMLQSAAPPDGRQVLLRIFRLLPSGRLGLTLPAWVLVAVLGLSRDSDAMKARWADAVRRA